MALRPSIPRSHAAGILRPLPLPPRQESKVVDSERSGPASARDSSDELTTAPVYQLYAACIGYSSGKHKKQKFFSFAHHTAYQPPKEKDCCSKVGKKEKFCLLLFNLLDTACGGRSPSPGVPPKIRSPSLAQIVCF
jgi:hypothetical protein